MDSFDRKIAGLLAQEFNVPVEDIDIAFIMARRAELYAQPSHTFIGEESRLKVLNQTQRESLHLSAVAFLANHEFE